MPSGFAALPHVGSHDRPVSAALDSFMTTGWGPHPVPAADQDPGHPDLTHRRERLSTSFPGERLVVPAGAQQRRSNDTAYRFRPHSAYAWLTGLTGEDQAGHALVLEPAGSDRHEAVLYIRPRSPRDSSGFYRDRHHGEFWVGRRSGLDETAALTGLRCEPLDDLPKLLTGSCPLTRMVTTTDPRLDPLVSPKSRSPARDAELETALSELRLVKEPWEVGQLQLAVHHTTVAFDEVVRALPRALRHPRGERWIEGVFNLLARAEGNGTGYDTIAASGANACVLHWTRNDGELDPSQLLLLDAGVETDTLYTADITRTLPLSGRFSPAQRDVYELVLAAQEAAIATLRPGALFDDFHREAMRVIAEGLHEWGVLRVSPEEALAEDNGLHRRYTLCGSGHMLGIDVHDCAQARADTYPNGVLEAGHVLTVEPGLYLQPDDETLPLELRGLGVRIEDDLLITANGAKLLSDALPRKATEVEEWMAQLLDD
ncbi:aminopeptidase P family protein [Streptomyces sp. NPDC008313]|uniref:aminopeptidase P family protein n=1 Tax=Streptomyces sp. NPDC008313 TaxID=3364826 RepID=UPI0036EAC1AB